MTDLYNDSAIRIVRNAGMCKRCGTEIESKHVHDFVECECESDKCFVDGGREYLRRGWTNGDDGQPVFEDLSESYEFECAIMKLDDVHWIEMRLLGEPEDIRVRRKISERHQEVLNEPAHKDYDALVFGYTAWRARSQEALIKELKRRLG